MVVALTLRMVNLLQTLGKTLGVVGMILLAGCGGQPTADTESPAGQGAPSLVSVTPPSPSNNNSPTLQGTAPAGAVISIFTNSTCSGTAAATGTADVAGNFSISVTVPNDATSNLYANAKINGTSTPCSPGSIAYVEDSTPPALPVVTSPATSPYTDQLGNSTFTIQGTCSVDTDHLTGPAGVVITPSAGTWSYVATLVLNGSVGFTFYAWDLAGNQSAGVTETIQWTPGIIMPLAGPYLGGSQADTGGTNQLESSLYIQRQGASTDATTSFNLLSAFNYIINQL